MTDVRTWAGNALTRRSVLRGGAAGLAGLAGAALLGCGGSKNAGGGGASPSNASDAATSGAPKNIKRAEGFDPKLGVVPVNSKKVVMGGTFTRAFTDTTREQDPDVSISGADAESVMDRL